MKLRAILELDYDIRERSLDEAILLARRDAETRMPAFVNSEPCVGSIYFISAKLEKVEPVTDDRPSSNNLQVKFAANAVEMIQTLMQPLDLDTVRSVRDAVRDAATRGESTDVYVPNGVVLSVAPRTKG